MVAGGHTSAAEAMQHEASALVQVGMGRESSSLERVSHPPPLAGPALAARYRKERTLWCGHSRTEEWMSTLAAAWIVSSVACISKGVPVIAFIACYTRDYPVSKAGMQRAMCGDAGGVQMCSDAHRRAVGVQ